ncbi:MAG TPA: hypothetical protein VKX17_22770 [Planctomycetota bacterium]|nr:hypothetical protein [Planctomycetota bacterium]
MALILALVALAFVAHAEENDTLVIKNEYVQRVLKKDGDVWRTVRFARADGSDAIEVQSDEFHILPMGSEKGWTVNDYKVEGIPSWGVFFFEEGWESAANQTPANANAGKNSYSIKYVPKRELPMNAPTSVTVSYFPGAGGTLRKKISFDLAEKSVDRVQVERFSTVTPASRGGRGEPVFCGDWFFGIEHPAAWNQHSSAPVGRPYDKLGNYSFINLDGREKEFEPRAGLISLAHFPTVFERNITLRPDLFGFLLVSMVQTKTAIVGIGKKADTPELGFMDYLNTIRRPVRSFIHYNNWYDGTGKNLKPDNFVDKIAHEFKTKMEPFGVKVDAFVPDNGWQNRNSIWQPNPRQFPDGMKSFAELGAALKKEGTSLGLWFTLNGYELNTDWGVKNGYFEAQRNPHFSRFNRYYSLGDPHYNADLRAQLSALIKDGQLNYIKHDFNDMCDSGPHNGTLPDDRHGHEKAVDETLSILQMERQINPDIFQNVTNWAWFSPWWLQHCNTIWMLSDDTGLNRKWPALSDCQMAITYRDAHLFKAWGNPATRPLVPISHLMTHGIVNATGAADGPMSDPLRDWEDYVLMYYARGVQLKEWYITPSKMDAAHWEVLGERTKWAQENSATLANAVYIGGNPEKGQAYGYVAWNGDKGIVTVRNPDMKEQAIKVPFDKTVWYRGENARAFTALKTYPLTNRNALDLKSGKEFSIKIPGWTTLLYELRPTASINPLELEVPAASDPIDSSNYEIKETHVAFDMVLTDRVGKPNRCVLALTVRGGEIPNVKVDGQRLSVMQQNGGLGWKTASFDLRSYWDKKIRVEIATAGDGIFPSAAEEMSIALLRDDSRELLTPKILKTGGAPHTLTAEQLKTITAAKIHIGLFGSDGGQFANKKLLINGEPALTLPANAHGDNWEEFVLDLPADALKKIALDNTLRVTNPSADKFKFRNVALAVKCADGVWVSTPLDAHVHCHDKEWAHFEGVPFDAKGESEPIVLKFSDKQ